MTISKIIIDLLKMTVVAGVAIAVSWFMFGKQGGGGEACKVDNKFRFTTKQGIEISAKAEGCRPDTLDLIDVLLKEPRTREVVTGRLRQQDRLFSITETAWVAELSTQLCPNYREVMDLKERAAAAKECVSQPVAVALREHAQNRRAPFLRLAQEKTMGVPAQKHQPQRNFANGCTGDSGLHGLFVRVSNPLMPERFVDVNVSGAYRCDDVGTYADIQLHPEDALDIMGSKRIADKLTRVLVLEQPRP